MSRRSSRTARRHQPIGWKKAVVFTTFAVFLSGALTAGAVIGVDLSLHKRFETAAGLNIRGYRGPVVARKQLGERRVVVLGGSTVFGYGLTHDQAFPPLLEQELKGRGHLQSPHRVSVVNLGYNSEGAYSFLYTLQDYQYLDYDLAILYTGYNDLEHNTGVFRHESLIFRLTGYYPIFPLVFKEKLMALRYGGNLEAAYRAKGAIFKPNVAAQEREAEKIRRSLAQQLGRLSAQAGSSEATRPTGDCQEPWTFYCQSVTTAVDYALAHGARVMVVTQPFISDRHVEQQQISVALLRQRYGDNPRLRHVNLGRGVIDLNDPSLCFDGIHLSLEGNERIAKALVKPVLELFEVDIEQGAWRRQDGPT